MEIVKLIIGQILPFVTIAVLIIGLIMRIVRWNKAPAGKMTVFPGSKSGGELVTNILKEVLIFKSLFEGNKGLWVGSWIFHGMLALICVGHLRIFAEALWFLGDPALIKMVSSLTGGAFGIILLITATYLFIRRLVVGSVREISDVEDYFALVLILAIVLTGDAMRFLPGGHIDLLTTTRPYFAALFTFGAVTVPENPWFLAHYALAQVLFLYMPFSKFLHIPGVFYSQALIQKA